MLSEDCTTVDAHFLDIVPHIVSVVVKATGVVGMQVLTGGLLWGLGFLRGWTVLFLRLSARAILTEMGTDVAHVKRLPQGLGDSF